MKLHTAALSYNSVRCELVLAEKGGKADSSVERVNANVLTGSHKTPDFLSKSLFGRLPMLEDGDFAMFESRAIGKYLAEKFKDVGPRLMPGDDASVQDRALWEMWFVVECEEFNSHGVAIATQMTIMP
jgi:glutathione S-transferase